MPLACSEHEHRAWAMARASACSSPMLDVTVVRMLAAYGTALKETRMNAGPDVGCRFCVTSMYNALLKD